MAGMARQKRSYLHHQGEFQHNYVDFVSLHDSDHDGVVRISVHIPSTQTLFTLITLRGATALLVAIAAPRLPRHSASYNSFQLTHMSRGNHAQSNAGNGDQREDTKL